MGKRSRKGAAGTGLEEGILSWVRETGRRLRIASQNNFVGLYRVRRENMEKASCSQEKIVEEEKNTSIVGW